MKIRPASKNDHVSWERMRRALWPSKLGEHAREITRYFDGDARELVEVLLAFDERGEAVGVIVLSIRAYAEGCVTDRVAFLEGWGLAYVQFRCDGVTAILLRAMAAGELGH